jgi:hypothetical protein
VRRRIGASSRHMTGNFASAMSQVPKVKILHLCNGPTEMFSFETLAQ